MFPWENELKIENEGKEGEANRKYQETWRSRNQEKLREKNKRFREENPDYLREWRKNNPDKVKASSIRQNDSEKRKEYMRDYMRKRRAAEKAEKKSSDTD